MQVAARIRAEILNAIARGEFTDADYAKHFPDSPYLKAKGFNVETDGDEFETVAMLWLKLTGADRAETTNKEYLNALKCHFFPTFGEKRIKTITYEQLLSDLAETEFKSPKTFNNIMTPARGLFAWCVMTNRIATDPTLAIAFREVQKPQPDPFELDEVEAILAHVAANYDEQWFNYFEFAFFSGVRPSEQIALQWPKLDLRRGSARIDTALVRKISKGVKNHESRDVELPARALAALTRQKKYSQLANEHVFLNPATRKAFADTSAPQEKVFQPTLRKLQIRPRDARNTRHTFATIGLMAGANPAYMAKQLGHSLEMFFTVYTKWIDGADRSRERGKIDAFSSSAPQSSHKASGE